MLNLNRKSKLILAALSSVGIIILGISLYFPPQKKVSVLAESTVKNEKTFTSQELKKYDGSNHALPIYLALDGNVYDISSGKNYYKLGGPYHYLAGKDSSSELHLFGESIIKKKYKIIGKLVE